MKKRKKNPNYDGISGEIRDFKRRIFIMSTQNNQYNTIEEALRDLREKSHFAY